MSTPISRPETGDAFLQKVINHPDPERFIHELLGQPDYRFDANGNSFPELSRATRMDWDATRPYPSDVEILLWVVHCLALQASDVVYDIGSGAGKAALFFGLASPARVRGVEIDENYARYSQARAQKMGLTQVDFVHADARDVDLSDGTVFYLFNPFLRAMRRDFINKVRQVSAQKQIRVVVAGDRWESEEREGWARLTSDDGLCRIYECGPGESPSRQAAASSMPVTSTPSVLISQLLNYTSARFPAEKLRALEQMHSEGKVSNAQFEESVQGLFCHFLRRMHDGIQGLAQRYPEVIGRIPPERLALEQQAAREHALTQLETGVFEDPALIGAYEQMVQMGVLARADLDRSYSALVRRSREAGVTNHPLVNRILELFPDIA